MDPQPLLPSQLAISPLAGSPLAGFRLAGFRLAGFRLAGAGLVVFGLLGSWGCSSRAMLTTWRPAETPTPGILHVAVADFEGPQGSGVATALTSRLLEADYFTLVDRSQVQLGGSVGGHQAVIGRDPAAFVARAAQLGIDGLILGEVMAYRCDDTFTEHSRVGLSMGTRENKHKKAESSGLGFGMEQNQIIQRDGTVELAFRLVDVRTGQVRATRRVGHSFSVVSVNGEPVLPPRHQILTQLLDQCLDDILVTLVPHTVPREVKLVGISWFSKAHRLVEEGVNAARAGRWAEAELAWKAALELDPKNPHILYNLAIAAEARHDFPTAEKYLGQAVERLPDELYLATLARLRQAGQSYQQVLGQRQARAQRPMLASRPAPNPQPPLPPPQVPHQFSRPQPPQPQFSRPQLARPQLARPQAARLPDPATPSLLSQRVEPPQTAPFYGNPVPPGHTSAPVPSFSHEPAISRY